MMTSATVRLLDIEPDLGRYLTPADLETLDGLQVPTLEIPTGEADLAGLMTSHRSFGMLILDGLLVRRLVVGDQASLRLLGPGDLVGPGLGPPTVLVSDQGWRVAAAARVALLDREVLLAAHRAPRLAAGLHARSCDQTDRVAVLLAISQLPRVEDRVLSLLWLLAESWGQVTAHGTALRLHLTHETIGGLIGARRSTVTLALGQLADDGAILRHERGWLLLEPPPAEHAGAPVHPGPIPEVLQSIPMHEVVRVEEAPPDIAVRLAELRVIREDLAGVRDRNRQRVTRELARVQETRRLSRELRRDSRRSRGSRARFHHDDDAGDGVGAVERQADDAAAERLAPSVDGVEH